MPSFERSEQPVATRLALPVTLTSVPVVIPSTPPPSAVMQGCGPSDPISATAMAVTVTDDLVPGNIRENDVRMLRFTITLTALSVAILTPATTCAVIRLSVVVDVAGAQ